MHIVDTHCHAGINWFEPVEMLLHQMNMNGVQSAVLIQHGGNYDNQYLLECVQRFPGRFAAVVGVDPTAVNASATLEGVAKEDGVVGLRLRPTDRSPGPDPLAI
jgi:L-fuconolactonase